MRLMINVPLRMNRFQGKKNAACAELVSCMSTQPSVTDCYLTNLHVDRSERVHVWLELSSPKHH